MPTLRINCPHLPTCPSLNVVGEQQHQQISLPCCAICDMYKGCFPHLRMRHYAQYHGIDEGMLLSLLYFYNANAIVIPPSPWDRCMFNYGAYVALDSRTELISMLGTEHGIEEDMLACLLYTSPSPRDS